MTLPFPIPPPASATLPHKEPGTCASSVYVYPHFEEVEGVGKTAYRLLRVQLKQNETYFFEPNYPITMVDRESIVVEVRQPSVSGDGSGIGSAVNVQILGDTDL